MMFAGGLMMGIVLLMMLAIIGIPALLVIALASGSAGYLHKGTEAPAYYQQPEQSLNPVARSDQSPVASTRQCAHCGAGLEAGWTHCPQCGTPINKTGR